MNARAIARAGLILLGVLSIILSIGCDPSEPEAGKKLPDRFARRYMPFKAGWIPESRITPPSKQESQMAIWEVTEYPPLTRPTPAQQKAADEFVERCYQAAVDHGWAERSKGIADGFVTKGADRLHHRNDEYVLDGVQLDPDRPEFLMYYADPEREGEYALAGFMFYVDGPDDRGFQFGGPLTVWHYHTYTNARCYSKGLISLGLIRPDKTCPEGSVPIHRSPEMIHVWLIDHPRGPFSSGMTLPPDVLRRGLAKRRAERGF